MTHVLVYYTVDRWHAHVYKGDPNDVTTLCTIIYFTI